MDDSKRPFPVKGFQGFFITLDIAKKAYARYRAVCKDARDLLEIEAGGGFTSDELNALYPPWSQDRYRQMCYEEATRSPIFLLQRRKVIVIDFHHAKYRYCDTCEGFHRRDIACEVAQLLSDDDLIKYEIAIPVWETCGVYLTREEGEDAIRHLRNRRIYCVPAEGKLESILKKHFS